MQFIFLGGRDFHASLTENSTQQYTFSIGDQNNGLAVVSCAASNENFSATKLDYTAYLRNKCALVKFDLGEMDTDIAITLNGMKTEVTVGFDGTVNGVKGLIILPDAWSPAGFTSGNSNWANVYTTEQGVDMEANGAVFYENNHTTTYVQRFLGCSVRLVRDAQ